MTHEELAVSIADCRAGRFRNASTGLPGQVQALRSVWYGQVIDASGIDDRSSTEGDEENWIITPPWPSGVVINRYEDVASLVGYDLTADGKMLQCVIATVGHGELPMPVYSFDIHMDDDGGFVEVKAPREFTEEDKATIVMGMASSTVCKAFDLCNGVNVAPAVPSRPRAERRRIERALGGDTIKTLHIWRKGRAATAANGAPLNGGVPLHEVRGHWAHYGDCCPGRHEPHGLLFGRYQGRVRKEIHKAGDPAFGIVTHKDVVLHDPQG